MVYKHKNRRRVRNKFCVSSLHPCRIHCVRSSSVNTTSGDMFWMKWKIHNTRTCFAHFLQNMFMFLVLVSASIQKRWILKQLHESINKCSDMDKLKSFTAAETELPAPKGASSKSPRSTFHSPATSMFFYVITSPRLWKASNKQMVT